MPSTPVSAAYAGITYSGGRAWISDQALGIVLRFAIDRNGFVTIPVEQSGGVSNPAGTGPIDSGGGVVWVANSSTPRLYRVDGTRASSIDLQGDSGTAAIDATEGPVWLARGDGRLTKLDPTRGQQETFNVTGSIRSISASEDSVWVADGEATRVLRVDADTGNAVASVAVGGRPADVAIAPDGSVWVTIQAP